MYRFRRFSATLSILCALALTPCWGAGCRTTQTPAPEIDLNEKSSAEILFHAIETTFRDRGLGVELASEKFMVVTSKFESLSERLRRRYTARIIRMKGGATALRVKAEHQRKHGSGADAVWRAVDSPVLNERASEPELEIARAIEKRFRNWMDMREEKAGDEGSSRQSSPQQTEADEAE